MIDPARKPVQAPPTKPTAKPAATHGLIKRARLVFFLCSPVLALSQVQTLYHFNSWF